MTSIPSSIAEIHSELGTELAWLHGRWICYRQLFGTSKERVDVLNQSAGRLFFFVEDVLRNDVVLALCKLTDPAKQGAFENLSFALCQAQLEKDGDPKLAEKNRELLAQLRSDCESFRELRNKRLAHLDLNASRKPHELPTHSRKMIEDALAKMSAYLNAIQLHYDDCETGYKLVMNTGDGSALISVLRRGLRYGELADSDVIHWNDLASSQWKDDDLP